MSNILSRDRVFTALNHKEPDRVPVDFASVHVTGIHKAAYDVIAPAAGFPAIQRYSFLRSGLVEPSEGFLQKVGSDVRGVWPNKQAEEYWAVEQYEKDGFHYIKDEWQVWWKRQVDGGLYYDVCQNPLPEEELEQEALDAYHYPVFDSDANFAGMYEKAKAAHDNGYAIFLENPMVELFQSQTKVRGYENFFSDLLIEPEMAAYMMAKTGELLEDYFERALRELADFPLIVRLSDDLGSQNSLLLSTDCYRSMIKPLHKKLIASIKKHAKNEVKIFFHTDGAIKELIPDFIDIGVDILNPIQYSCTGMDSAELKRTFGKDLSFWGGGIDTQTSFRTGTAAQIKDEVRRQMELLAPGGGFVFSQIHNFQKGTEPEKFWAVWDAVKEYGNY